MPSLVGLRDRVDLPPVEVARGGFLGTALVIPTTGHALMGAEYDTMACAQGYEWIENCEGPDCAEPKKFDNSPTDVEGDPFTVYAGVDCELGTAAENEARARQALAYSERRQIDHHLWNWAIANADPWLPLATDLTHAIGIAEMGIANRYGGVGMIWIPVSMVAEACHNGLVAPDLSGTLRTCQGTPVVNMARPDVPDALFASGRVTLLQGPVMTFSVGPMTSCDNLTTEPARALAERTYVPLIECAVGAISFGIE